MQAVPGLVEASDGDGVKERWGLPKVEVTERWNGCRLVNPLCPDDLCWLPALGNHVWHCLGTDPWDYRFTLPGTAFFMSKKSNTAEELIHEGWIYQLRHHPGEAEFRRLTNPELYYEAFPDEAPPRWLKQLKPKPPAEPPYDARIDRPRSHSTKNSLISPTGYNRNKDFPCWCGESIVGRYRQMAVCCVDYLTVMGPHIYLDLA